MARKPDDRRECFAAIGEALTEWSYMELSLAKLFCAAASAIDDEAAYRAFWTALSFEGKLKMTDAAMQVVGDGSRRVSAEIAAETPVPLGDSLGRRRTNASCGVGGKGDRDREPRDEGTIHGNL